MWTLILLIILDGPPKKKVEVSRIEPFWTEESCTEAADKFWEMRKRYPEANVIPVCVEKK